MHRSVEFAWGLVPKPVQDLIAAGIDHARGVTPPAPPEVPTDRPSRMLIGPVNYAGQGYRWSRALEESGRVWARNFVHDENNVLRYPADYTVAWRTAEHSRPWQNSMAGVIGTDFTDVLIEACFPVLGGMYSGDVRKQVALMRRNGARVGIVGHGTDVRLPSRHLTTTPWSHFVDSDEWVAAEKVEKVVAANLALVQDLSLPTFVSTAGLLIDLPQAHFLGVVIDPERWANDRPVLQRDRIKVIHAPTNPHVKGSPLIAPVAQRLHDEGLIEFIQLDRIPNDEMPAVLADTDVILDQFRIGDYGVAACEAMAAGRVVLAHVTAQVRDEVERHAGMTLPIPEATPDTLESVLRDIVAHRDRYRDLAATGMEFVHRLHDGSFSRDVLLRHLVDA